MVGLFEFTNVWNIIKADPPTGDDSKTSEDSSIAYTQWKEKDTLLKTWLITTCSEECIALVVGCNTAKEIWELLEEEYLQSTKDKKFQLKDKLRSLKLGGNQPIKDYIREFKGVCDNLAAINKPVPEDDKVLMLAQGCGGRYKIIRSVMFSKPPYPSFKQFVNAIEAYDMREGDDGREQKNENLPVDQSMAFTAQGNQQGRGRGSNHSRGRSFYSGVRGFRPVAQGSAKSEGNQEKLTSLSAQIKAERSGTPFLRKDPQVTTINTNQTSSINNKDQDLPVKYVEEEITLL